MNITTALSLPAQARSATATRPVLQRWSAWLTGGSSPETKHHTRDSAAMLYARAARYEGSQPGFAADLRTAAEAIERVAAKPAR